MKTPYVLFLASKSYSRQMLLKKICIPFLIINQDANETNCDWTLPLPDVVLEIARLKMKHAEIPSGNKKGEICFVLTADTLGEDIYGHKHGKATDLEDAYKKINALEQGCHLATGFCITKNKWDGSQWIEIARKESVVFTDYTLILPKKWQDMYFENTIALQCAGAHAGEDFGMQFVKDIKGSYSGALGLPLFELREALEELEFFANK